MTAAKMYKLKNSLVSADCTLEEQCLLVTWQKYVIEWLQLWNKVTLGTRKERDAHRPDRKNCLYCRIYGKNCRNCPLGKVINFCGSNSCYDDIAQGLSNQSFAQYLIGCDRMEQALRSLPSFSEELLLVLDEQNNEKDETQEEG